MGVETTRLAPSPTGALHLGNARTFLITWAMARQVGMRLLMRIDDLDGPRVKPGAAEQALDDLRWLGLDWDGDPVCQRADLSHYDRALARLAEAGLVYGCRCSRREVAEALSAPHGEGRDPRYPGTCRDRGVRYRVGGRHDGEGDVAIRLRVPPGEVAFTDTFQGRQAVNVQQDVGDFVVGTKSGLPAYQLAVVVDDHRQRVTRVVRGDDLLPSTARQLWCYRLLGLGPEPAYTHLPLVVGRDGRRLAKRHGDTRLSYYRDRGVPAERVVGLIAKWCGVLDRYDDLDAPAFLRGFEIERLAPSPVVLTHDDERYLLP